MNTAKNQQIFFWIKKQQRGAQNTIKLIIVDKNEITGETHNLECIREFNKTHFKNAKRKLRQKLKVFYMVPIF